MFVSENLHRGCKMISYPYLPLFQEDKPVEPDNSNIFEDILLIGQVGFFNGSFSRDKLTIPSKRWLHCFFYTQ